MRSWNWLAGAALGIPLFILGCYAAARAELSGRRNGSLAALIRDAEAAALVGDWEEAARQADEAYVRFRTRRFWLQLGLAKEALAQIEAALGRLRTGIYRREKGEVVFGASRASEAIKEVVPLGLGGLADPAER